MVRSVEGTCDIGVGMLRQACRRDAIASCVYCGRKFCEQHGERGQDHTDTCSRKACRRKRIDVLEHIEWKERVYASNRVSVCGAELCGERTRHLCIRCQLLFCGDHVRSMRVVSRSGMGDQGRGPVCDHCRKRRRVWE